MRNLYQPQSHNPYNLCAKHNRLFTSEACDECIQEINHLYGDPSPLPYMYSGRLYASPVCYNMFRRGSWGHLLAEYARVRKVGE